FVVDAEGNAFQTFRSEMGPYTGAFAEPPSSQGIHGQIGIKLSGTTTFEGTTLEDAIAGSDGLILVDNGDNVSAYFDGAPADVSNIYVDSAYTSKNVGEGKIFGVNAFTNSLEALTTANEQGGAVIHVDGMGSDLIDGTTVKLTNSGDYTITGGNGRASVLFGLSATGENVNLTFKDAAFRVGKLYVPTASNTLTVENSVIGTAHYSGHSTGWATAYSAEVTIKDSLFGINYSNFTDEEIAAMPRSAEDLTAAITAGSDDYLACGANNSGFHFGTLGEATVEDSTMMTSWIAVIDRALMNLDNSVLYYGGAISIGAARVDETLGSYDTNESGWDVLNWWSASEGSAAGFREGEVATLNITDSIVRNVGGGNGDAGAHVQVGGVVAYGKMAGNEYEGVLNITNSDFSTSYYDAEGNVVAKSYDMLVVTDLGSVNVTDSTFTSGKVINNGGLFNVNGEATLSIGSLTGEIVLNDEAVLSADTSITGAVEPGVMSAVGILRAVDADIVAGGTYNNVAFVVDGILNVTGVDLTDVYTVGSSSSISLGEGGVLAFNESNVVWDDETTGTILSEGTIYSVTAVDSDPMANGFESFTFEVT
ncbi:MAG: hypothetical protein J6T08_08335, partial [Lentisphaeria bacterium]|nr:hypothetical protein [Lentisphaeria bacterium]